VEKRIKAWQVDTHTRLDSDDASFDTWQFNSLQAVMHGFFGATQCEDLKDQ